MLEKFSDRETAVMISKYFALDIGRDSQSQFAIFRGQRNHGDTEIQKVQDYIEKNYCDKITIETLAGLINTGRRTFEDSKKLRIIPPSNTYKESGSKLPKAFLKHPGRM